MFRDERKTDDTVDDGRLHAAIRQSDGRGMGGVGLAPMFIIFLFVYTYYLHILHRAPAC